MTQSRPLTHDEFLAEAMPRFRQVFESRDPFGAPFRLDVPRRVILYQEFLYSLDDEQFAGLTTAAKSVGDTKLFEFATEVTVTAAMVAGRSLDPRHELLYESDPAYVFFLDEPTAYLERPAPFQNPSWETTLVSGSGKWGLLLSHERAVIVGGSEDFMSTLLDSYPGVEILDGDEQVTVPPADQVNLFLDDVEGWRRPDHVPSYLAHIYGREEATRLIGEAVARGKRGWRFPDEHISPVSPVSRVARVSPANSLPKKIGASLFILGCGAICLLAFLWALGADVAPVDPAYGLDGIDSSAAESRVAYFLTAVTFSVPVMLALAGWYLLDRLYAFPGEPKPEDWPLITRALMWIGFLLTLPAVGIGGNIVIVALFFTLVGGP